MIFIRRIYKSPQKAAVSIFLKKHFGYSAFFVNFAAQKFLLWSNSKDIAGEIELTYSVPRGLSSK